MQICILAIGKESSKELGTLQLDYERRLKPFASLDWKLLPASRFTEPDQVRSQDSEQLLSALKPNDVVMLLDERGEQQTNQQFVKTFERLSGTHGQMVIIIGGAFGVSDAVRERSQFVWSFSKLVFPHQIMRVLILEQLYRTFMVQKNHPYHHN